MINVRKAFFVLGVGLMTLPLGAGDCPGGPTGDAGVGDCELDTDCPDLEQCHPTLQVCEVECVDDSECTGDRPVCNVAGDGGTYILEVDGIRDLCICDDSSCGDGEVCNADTGVCEEGEDPGDDCTADATLCMDDETCNDTSGECECTTVGDTREDDTVCQEDGMWAAPCSDSDCYEAPAIELCQFDTTVTDGTYNMCVDANILTGDCDAADNAATSSGNTPVIWEVSTLIAPVADACNDGTNDLPVRSYFIGVYSTVDLTAVSDLQAARPTSSSRMSARTTPRSRR